MEKTSKKEIHSREAESNRRLFDEMSPLQSNAMNQLDHPKSSTVILVTVLVLLASLYFSFIRPNILAKAP
ncbi:hypothetical protein M441DRAFT_412111 [Trichoderma asperellum CBS 433.97]|uniref:Uncharacterized protein n=1 Tax=Trichoderma asperellum (strain ATCC 204424 / CBS 433.97 / NBRC 101777) TaxID=1042311 RepID=A0A2T3Z7I5_TRIA4|nr:hypothetical protein M441DRAFT_412111 [Trichoderma asperellum CBS 433.97]PTB40774.1 hypothetical protein M441DRAFT_412111 [Trichoderma asperellum CBS 433.97]